MKPSENMNEVIKVPANSKAGQFIQELHNRKQQQNEKAMKISRKDIFIVRDIVPLKQSQREYFRKIYQNPPLEHLSEFQQILRVKLYSREVFPAFFYGNLNLKRPIITISLNPKWDKDKAIEQGNNFDNWLNDCMKGFLNYPTDKSMHTIWKNLVKVIRPDNLREAITLREILFENIVNIDWCYYYSKQFPTLNEEQLRLTLSKKFDENLEKIFSWIHPRAIFIHGRSFATWFNTNCNNIVEELTLSHGDQEYKVLSATFSKNKIPVVYQEWFVNRGNKNENLEAVRRLLYSKI